MQQGGSPTSVASPMEVVDRHPPVLSFRDPDLVSQVHHACSTWGVFVLTDTPVDAALKDQVLKVGHDFFQLPPDVKDSYNLQRFGARWRGYMPYGGENSAVGTTVDRKEGLYLGAEDPPDHPRVLAKLPTFGANVLPDSELPHMRELLDEYHSQMTDLGNQMMDLLSAGLGLEESYLKNHVTCHDPVVLPRMFRYFPSTTDLPCVDDGMKEADVWGIGRHSDYGLWTMLLTDSPGLEFQHPVHKTWHAVPFVQGAIVMSVGDVLDRLSSGRFVSAYHRARNLSSTKYRLSLPFFYDPAWTARMKALPIGPEEVKALATEERAERWKHTKITCSFDQEPFVEYSEFLAKKVAKVFPELVPEELWRTIRSTSEPSTRHALVVSVPEAIITERVREELVQFYQEHPEIKESHGVNHALAVYHHADRAVEACRPPLPSTTAMEIVVAALLHDVDDSKYFGGSGNEGDELYVNAKALMSKANIPSSHWESILYMIDLVSCSKNGNSVPEIIAKKEAYHLLIPRWADRVEAVGAKGVLRCYQYNQEKKRALSSPSSPRPQTEDEIWNKFATPARFQAYQDRGGTSADMISHYYDKLLHLCGPPAESVRNSYLEQKLRDSAEPLIEMCLRFGKTSVVDVEYIHELKERIVQ